MTMTPSLPTLPTSRFPPISWGWWNSGRGCHDIWAGNAWRKGGVTDRAGMTEEGASRPGAPISDLSETEKEYDRQVSLASSRPFCPGVSP